uniref:Uncharacterized protein n=1 Tax=Polysiphonia scopulorum TaxID=257860 RepID=A0A1Z1MIH1_9FLOR|nr:hypothetical protein [Polysiphonia scopulorum]ARW65615.1 hypothetical protein [Polysiphonia scopulorum]
MLTVFSILSFFILTLTSSLMIHNFKKFTIILIYYLISYNFLWLIC